MEYAENILETIGNTPLVKMNKLVEELPCLVLAKYETFNPGNCLYYICQILRIHHKYSPNLKNL